MHSGLKQKEKENLASVTCITFRPGLSQHDYTSEITLQIQIALYAYIFTVTLLFSLFHTFLNSWVHVESQKLQLDANTGKKKASCAASDCKSDWI